MMFYPKSTNNQWFSIEIYEKMILKQINSKSMTSFQNQDKLDDSFSKSMFLYISMKVQWTCAQTNESLMILNKIDENKWLWLEINDNFIILFLITLDTFGGGCHSTFPRRASSLNKTWPYADKTAPNHASTSWTQFQRKVLTSPISNKRNYTSKAKIQTILGSDRLGDLRTGPLASSPESSLCSYCLSLQTL